MKNILYILLLLSCFMGCKTPEPRLPISKKTGSFIDQSVALNKQLNAKQHKQIQTIITNNPDVNYISSENGFWYFYHYKSEDSLATVNFGDVVNFNYSVASLNNTLIYSETELGNQNYTMDKEKLFSGLREGLKLMHPGDTISFLFPSQKAYGFYGDEDKIGHNMPIICKVSLNTITKKES